MTEQTGGRHFAVDNLAELPDVAAKIGIELRNRIRAGLHAQECRRATENIGACRLSW